MRQTLFVLALTGCIDLDRGPEWETGQWRDTGALPDTGRTWADDSDPEVEDSAWVTPDEPRCTLLSHETGLPLLDGDDVFVYWGSQGLWHIFASVACEDIAPGGTVFDFANPDNPVAAFELLDDERGLVAGYFDLPRGMDVDGEARLVSEQLVLRTTTCEENLGKTMTLRFAVTDHTGAAAETGVRVHLAPDPAHVFPDDTDAADTDDTDTDAADTDTDAADTDATDTDATDTDGLHDTGAR